MRDPLAIIRQRALTYLDRRLLELDEADATQLTEELRQQVLADPAFVEEAMRHLVGRVVVEELREYAEHTAGVVRLGEKVVQRNKLSQIASQGSIVWAKWVEQINGKPVRLVEMGRKELLAAAAFREDESLANLEFALLYKKLAGRLAGAELVGERWSAAEIDAARAEIRAKLHARSA
jgi:hypothetical protein